MNIIIRAKHVDLTPELEVIINEKLSGLFKIFDHILKIKVELSKTTEHHRHGEIFEAEINLNVPGELLNAQAEKNNLVEAIEAAKLEMAQEIKKYKGKKQTQERKNRRA